MSMKDSSLSSKRAALRHHIAAQDPSSLSAADIIEFLLQLSLPRRDVSALTQLLVHKYGTLQALCQRPVQELKLIPGLGENVIATLKALYGVALEMTKAPLVRPTCLHEDMAHLLPHSRLRLHPPEIEKCLVYYLDAHKHLIMDEIHQVGTFDRVTIYPREIIRSALNTNAHGMILVHNHPNGNPYPSSKDLIMTQKIKEMAKTFQITLYDHVIIANDQAYSIQRACLL